MMMKKFSPRISFRKTWIFYAVFGMFAIFGILLLSGVIHGGQTSFESPWPSLSNEQFAGLCLLSLCTIIILIILAKNLAIFSWYGVTSDSLIMKMNGFKTNIKFSDISSIEEIGTNSVKSTMTSMRERQVYPGELIFNRLKTAGMLLDTLRYNTVPIVFDEIGIHRQGIKIFTKAQTDGNFVVLILKNNSAYLLSPKDTSGYLDYVNLHTRNLSTVDQN